MAKTDRNFTNISNNMMPSCSSGEIYGCIEVSARCFIIFNILIHNENKYY